MIPVFDGHNDTITREDADGFVTGRPDGHIDLERARAGGLAGGIFAVFTPRPATTTSSPTAARTGSYALPVAAPSARTSPHRTPPRRRAPARARARGHVRLVRAPGDLDAARADGVLAAVLHLEGAEAIDPGLEALDLWHAAGLRSLGPVWSRPNAFAHGVPFAFPSSPDTGPGLTAAGTALVRRCAELGIAIDLSHLNAAGFWDVAGSTVRR